MRKCILIALLIFIVACQPTATSTTITCDDGTVVLQGTECPKPTKEEIIAVLPDIPETPTPPAIEEVVKKDSPIEEGAKFELGSPQFRALYTSDEQPTALLSDDLEEIRARAVDKAQKGYAYHYSVRKKEGNDNLITLGVLDGVRIFVNGNQRILDFEDDVVHPEIKQKISHIYANLDTEVAKAWCEINCADPDVRDVDALLAGYPTPEFWMREMDGGEKTGERSVKSKQVAQLEVTIQGTPASMLVDKFSGLPIEVTVDDITYVYDNLALGAPEDQFTWPQ